MQVGVKMGVLRQIRRALDEQIEMQLLEEWHEVPFPSTTDTCLNCMPE